MTGGGQSWDAAARAALKHSLARIAATPVSQAPFPHMVVRGIFPEDFYQALQENLLPDDSYARLADSGRVSKKYNAARLCLFPAAVEGRNDHADSRAFWKALFAAYQSDPFTRAWLVAFRDVIKARVDAGDLPDDAKGPNPGIAHEIFLMRDLVNYSLSPHTDSPRKAVSVLFYLPRDAKHPELGTSLYAPKQAGLTDAGGPHLPRERFDLVETLPFEPNTLVAFPKTDRCFHGVEPVSGPDQRRDILLFDIKFAGAAGKLTDGGEEM